MKSLLKKWRECKETEIELEFQYTDSRNEKRIVEALVFWKFIFDKCPSENWTTRRNGLRAFIRHSNPLIGLIAIIESMPTMVWRKMLWKYNIDFMSFESFLRRINESQITGIKENYSELHLRHKIPCVFSWWDCFFRKVSVGKILSESYNYDKRYCNKGAMSYNLLGLDFGFNAYPNGVVDDYKNIEISPLRFLSVKKHDSDFVVNTESGMYWWLYRKARSNYVWKPDRIIELNKHICPGFWYTIFIHFLFWIISPLAFAGTFMFFRAAPWWFISASIILGIITPLWLFLALIKCLETNFFKKDVYKKYRKIFDNLLDSLLTAVAIITAVCFIIVVIATLGCTVFIVFVNVFGTILSIFATLAVYTYFGYKIYFKNKYGYYCEIAKYPIYFQILFIGTAGAFFTKILINIFVYRVEIMTFIVSFFCSFANFIMSIWNALIAVGLPALLMVITFVLLILLHYYRFDNFSLSKRLLLKNLWFQSLDDEKRKNVLEQVKRTEREEKKTRENRKLLATKKTKKVIEKIFWPIIFPIKCTLKLIEYAKTFHRLYELFNERCPFVTPKKVLQI
ncbi:MAG: hypothetical protein AAB653_02335 [Patescibacteria group bacterium]